jgi:hypothetical protein
LVRKERRRSRSFSSEAKKLSLTALMLLCQVEGGCVGEVGDEERVEAAGEVAHDAAGDLFAAESFCGASGGVGAGLGVVDEPVVGDCPERVVALSVSAAVDPVSFDFAA